MSESNRRTGHVDRRDFLRIALAGGGVLWLPATPRAAEPGPSVDVWVIHGEDKARLMAEALKIIRANGGFGRGARSLALKVNAAWTRTPEMGACTHPDLVSAFISGAKEDGLTNIEVPENPCNRAEESFARSGVEAAVRKAGAKMYDLKKEARFFAETALPRGRVLQKAKVAKQFLEADVVVNMPVAKHHGAAVLTMAMKNWMGAVEDRSFWHRNNLMQCIADFCSLVRPHWTLIDATRVMLKRGPQGGELAFLKSPSPNLLIVSKDQVAADAYATMLFDKKPADVAYLGFAAEMNLGITDLARIKVHAVEAGA